MADPKSLAPDHYIEIDERLCNGCVLCIKACPTKAIRVIENRLAQIEGTCIDCGECVRVCPRGAAKGVTREGPDIRKFPYSTVCAPAVLYSQFGEDVMPNDVLLALRRMGFQYVHDQAYTNEIFNLATEIYIQEQRGRDDARWPLISPICPVVVKLIQHRFPALLEHIPPLLTPREIVAREAKRRLSVKYGCRPEDIKVTYISSCPAKILSIREPLLQKHSYMDGAVGINLIHEEIKKNIQHPDDDKVLHHSGGVGLGWAVSGGEIAGIDANCLAVSGLQETIRYLEQIEMGALRDIEYVEFRTSAAGCMGGLLNVIDKYKGKRHVQKLVRMFGVEKRVQYTYVKRLYDQGWFFAEREAAGDVPGSRAPVAERITRLSRIEETLKTLPRKECGVCGSPDCQTFAEDIVDGTAARGACLFIGRRQASACTE